MTPLLEVVGAQAGYGTLPVLFGVDLTIKPGEAVTLLGRNGMGKTTTVRCIVGLLKATAGTIRFEGRRIDGWTADRVGRAGIALVPEGRRIFPNLSVRENLIAFAADRRGAATPWTLERVYALFPSLAERADNMGSQLSGGEQQMLAIGRALMTNPSLLILDEATEGLAPLLREEIWRVLAELRRTGLAILAIDKYVDRLVKLAERHTILERGRVAWAGASAELAADRRLWSAISASRVTASYGPKVPWSHCLFPAGRVAARSGLASSPVAAGAADFVFGVVRSAARVQWPIAVAG
jgi:branched-chain amino acid transport system ATP-binding protein